MVGLLVGEHDINASRSNA